jgi:hypothetical protein
VGNPPPALFSLCLCKTQRRRRKSRIEPTAALLLLGSLPQLVALLLLLQLCLCGPMSFSFLFFFLLFFSFFFIRVFFCFAREIKTQVSNKKV